VGATWFLEVGTEATCNIGRVLPEPRTPWREAERYVPLALSYDEPPLGSVPGVTKLRADVRVPVVASQEETAPGPFPLAIFAHGRRATQCVGVGIADSSQDSYLGYGYLMDQLAEQGIVSISVDLSDAGCLNDKEPGQPDRANIDNRVRAILQHMTLLGEMNVEQAPQPAGGTLAGRIDFDEVVLIGHSRVGETVLWLAERDSDLALTAPIVGGVRTPSPVVRSVISLAPLYSVGSFVATKTGVVILPSDDYDLRTVPGARFMDESQPGTGDFFSQSYLVMRFISRAWFAPWWRRR
jgi:hypothetical protein